MFGLDAMKLTVFILFLPVAMFLTLVFLIRRHASDALLVTYYFFWIFAALVCLVRGIFIFQQNKRLAWCCFGVTLLQVTLVILPAFATAKIRGHLPKSLEPTAAPLSGLAQLPFRATCSSGCGSVLIR